MVTISCVIPALNEHDNLCVLLPLLKQVLARSGARWEIIVVDDGSTDATPLLMADWARLPGFRYLRLSRNFGKEAALTAGMRASHGEVVALLDADLQHDPALLLPMLERWRQGVQNVYAVRAHRRDESAIKRVGTRLFYTLLNAQRGVVVPPDAGDFRLMDRCVVQALLSLPERTRFMKGLYAWVGFRSEPFLYTPAARARGHSRYSPLRLLGLALSGLTAFSTLPLRLVSLAGGVLAVLAFAYGLFIVIEALLFGNPVPGWPTLVAVSLFFFGVNLVCIGIVGEYVARIFDEVKARPLYVMAQELGGALAEPDPLSGLSTGCGRD